MHAEHPQLIAQRRHESCWHLTLRAQGGGP